MPTWATQHKFDRNDQVKIIFKVLYADRKKHFENFHRFKILLSSKKFILKSAIIILKYLFLNY